ncbi:MAG: MFS transporter, partial [Gaiellaceae bacterium]
SGWTTLLAGFLIGGFGIGMVNPPLATTAVSVVPPQRAGMAAGVNNTFRQVGIATGIAGLGAIFQSSYHVGGTPADFVHGLNSILLVATFVALAGAVLAFALVRGEDFVVSGPAPAGH